MLTVKRRPNGIPALGNVFEDFFNTAFPEKFMNERSVFTPSVNIAENEKAYSLEFAVPGFEKKDFNIEIEKEFIKISGKKEISAEVKEKNFTRKEFSFGSFERTFTLPEQVETEKIEALYENGILHVTLPKKEVKAETKSQKIEIK